MGLLDIFKRTKVGVANTKGRMKKREFKMAQSGRLFNDWRANNNSPDTEIRHDLELLRNRGRDLARNNEFARRYLKLLERNVVGKNGIQLQMKAAELNGQLDTVANNNIERAWKLWGKLGSPTLDGRYDWVDCQRFVINSIARDGEAFAILHQNDDPAKPAIQIEFIEPELVDEDYNETLSNGNVVRMGVETDQHYRPVAYHVFYEHPGEIYFNMRQRRNLRRRIPAERVIHVYFGERAGQTRGVPELAAAAAPLKMLSGFREASLVASRASAAKMGFFRTPGGDQFPADDFDDQIPLTDAQPGSFFQLPPGVEFQEYDPSHPHTNFADFEKQMLKGVASALNVSYIDLANDLESVSYSSIRQGALADRDNYQALQEFMASHFLQPVFEFWIATTLDQQRLQLPIEKINKWIEGVTWRGRGWNWVDPQKEMNAAITGIKNGVLSMQDVANQYGRDVETTFQGIARDKQMAETYGLKIAFEPFGAQQMPIDPEITGGDDGN